MPAITEAGVGDLRHQHAGLGAAYVNRRQKILLLIRHAYGCSSPLTIAGLGLLPGLVTTVPVAGGAAGVVFAVVGAADVFGAELLCVDGDCVEGGFVCAKLWVCPGVLPGFDGAFAVTLWCAF